MAPHVRPAEAFSFAEAARYSRTVSTELGSMYEEGVISV